MCDPSTVIAVVGVAVSAYGQYAQGQAANKAAKYNAQMDEYNASLAPGRQADAEIRGQRAVEQVHTDAARQIGEGKASFAAGNVDLSSGSVKYWELDSVGNQAADAAMTKYNSDQEQAGYGVEAWNARSSARLSRMQGRSAQQAGNIGAASSLLAGAAQTSYTFRGTSTTKPPKPR